jgi:hypothetical protein
MYNNGSIEFTCKGRKCETKLNCKLGETSNLNKHLKNVCKDNSVREWYTQYALYTKNNDPNLIINDHQLNLIKYFISSNSALQELKNPNLISITIPELKMPSEYVFRNTLLPEVMKNLRKCQENKLNNAETISLMTDLWTNRANSDFIAVAASCSNSCFDREIFIIDMVRMEGRHTAENIKKAIEIMINKFEFDKSKISGIF